MSSANNDANPLKADYVDHYANLKPTTKPISTIAQQTLQATASTILGIGIKGMLQIGNLFTKSNEVAPAPLGGSAQRRNSLKRRKNDAKSNKNEDLPRLKAELFKELKASQKQRSNPLPLKNRCDKIHIDSETSSSNSPSSPSSPRSNG